MVKNPRHACHFSLVLTAQHERAEVVLSFLVGRVQELCIRLSTIFFPTHLGIFVQKSLSATCIQPLKSPFSPTRTACLQRHYKCSLSVLYRRRTGEPGLSFAADFWVARDTSPLSASHGAGALARVGESPIKTVYFFNHIDPLTEILICFFVP